jgi:hypothetical protein
MYTLVLLVHSWLRWVALAAGVAAIGTSFSDRGGAKTGGAAERWGLIFMIVLDLQMLLGLLLYLVLSPFTTEAMRDFGAAMRSPGLRFFAVEHLVMMFAAVILAHVGRVLARKAKTPEAKRTRRLICYGLAMVVMLLGIPWPGMPAGRPLFRLQ